MFKIKIAKKIKRVAVILAAAALLASSTACSSHMFDVKDIFGVTRTMRMTILMSRTGLRSSFMMSMLTA